MTDMLNKVVYRSYLYKESQGRYELLYVLLVLKKDKVYKVFYMSYFYLGKSLSIRSFICPTCIKDCRGQ